MTEWALKVGEIMQVPLESFKQWVQFLLYSVSFVWAVLFLRLQMKSLWSEISPTTFELISLSFRIVGIVMMAWLVAS